MAQSVTNYSSFPLFPSLPSELRNQIWRDALPDMDRPALCVYRKGCWCPKQLQIPYPYGGSDLFLVFDHDLLAPIMIAIPLIFVNREARDIALGWVREQGIEMRFREETQGHIFVRRFNPKQDALYVPPHKWDDFCSEPTLRMFEPDLIEQGIGDWAEVTRIALPEDTVINDCGSLVEIIGFFRCLEVLLIMVNSPSDLQAEDGESMVQRWCGFESVWGRGSRTRAPARNSEHGGIYSDGEGASNEALEELLKQADKLLKEELPRNPVGLALKEDGEIPFEVRPIYAVRK